MNKKILAVALAIIVVSGISSIFVIRSVEAPNGERKDPYGKYRFLIEIDGIIQAGFREVEGLNVTVDVVEYREGNEPTFPRLSSGLASCGPLVLRYGATDNMELWNWMKLVLQGEMEDARRNMAVILMDREGNPAARYELSQVWPSSFRVGKLDSLGSSSLIEELVIQYETFERVQ